MIGKVNSAGGIKKLVMAQGEDSSGVGGTFYVNLTCDFDPLVVVAAGPSHSGGPGNYQVKYKLTKNGVWQDAIPKNSSLINISGRTLRAGPFSNPKQGFTGTGYIIAFGFPD